MSDTPPLPEQIGRCRTVRVRGTDRSAPPLVAAPLYRPLASTCHSLPDYSKAAALYGQAAQQLQLAGAQGR